MAVTAHAGGGVRWWLSRIGTAIGFGTAPPPVVVPETVDYGTRLSERRTRLALERSFVAAERTLMAWIRTALSMISFGFTIAKVLEALERERGLTYGIFGHSWSPTTLGIALITIGTGALVVAVIQHRTALKGLRREGLTPRWSLALVVATLVSLLGVFAFGSLMLNV